MKQRQNKVRAWRHTYKRAVYGSPYCYNLNFNPYWMSDAVNAMLTHLTNCEGSQYLPCLYPRAVGCTFFFKRLPDMLDPACEVFSKLTDSMY